MSNGWQAQERIVADWFGTKRNPLSGRNNRNDDGSLRLGDILFKPAVIEVKRRKTMSLIIADAVRKLAKEYNKPWALFEFKTGRRDVVCITLDAEHAKIVAAFLCNLWKARRDNGI